jgi:uncharacterized integral membrane protein
MQTTIRILKPMGTYSEKQARKYLKVGLISLIPLVIFFLINIDELPFYMNWGRYEVHKGMIMGISATFGAFFLMLPYRTWKSGLNGERAVIKNISDKLSGEYSLFNDVLLADGKRMGNIDHIIVGPPGVFVMETKNNRGQVSFDGYRWKGVSKNPSDQVERNLFRVKNLLKQCQVFAQKTPYVYGILVFSNNKAKLTIDQENLRWTNRIIRIKNQSDRSLADYIMNEPTVFSPNEISLIEQFLKAKISNYNEAL